MRERGKDLNWITANDCLFDGETGKILRISWGPHISPKIFRGRRMCAAVFGPSSFFKKELFLRAGGFEENLRYSMDSHLWAKFAMMGIVPFRLLRTCWKCRVQPESKTFGVQSDEMRRRKYAEVKFIESSTGYFYRCSFSNIWYVLWIACRVLDGSLFVRCIRKLIWTGRGESCI